MKRDGNAIIDGSLELGEVRDGGLENLVAEGMAYLGHVGELERAGTLELRDNIAQELQSGVVVPPHPLDNGPDTGRAAGRPIGRFQRDDDEIRSTEGRVTGQRHPRRAVQQNVIVILPKLGNRVGQDGMKPLTFPLTGLREVLPGKVSRDRDNVDVRVFGVPDEIAGLGAIVWIKHPFDAAGFRVVGKETLRDVRLLVEIHDQAALAAFLANGRNEPAEVRLADAAFEVERSDNRRAPVGKGWHGLIVPSSGRKSRIVYRQGIRRCRLPVARFGVSAVWAT